MGVTPLEPLLKGGRGMWVRREGREGLLVRGKGRVLCEGKGQGEGRGKGKGEGSTPSRNLTNPALVCTSAIHQ